MKEQVEQIIRGIDKGKAFDTHFIIDALIKEHRREYFIFVARYVGSPKNPEYASHDDIAEFIASFNGVLTNKLPYLSHSYGVLGTASTAALWERI